MGKRAIIVADAGVALGFGHVMRCMALAGAMRRRGWKVTFMGQLSLVSERIASVGFDVQSTMEPADLLIVDNYGLDAEWEKQHRSMFGRVVVIDDLANRNHECDVLIDMNPLGGERYDGRVPEHCTRLLGLEYALLRNEFSRARKTVVVRERASRVLVAFGGSDPRGLTQTAVRLAPQFPELTFDVLLGSAAQQLESRAPNITVHRALADVTGLLSTADLGIGAGGTMAWERFCLGVPNITVSVAPNQVAPMDALGRAGLVWYAGEAESITEEALASKLRAVLIDDSERIAMTNAAMAAVDGLGAERVAEVITS